MSVKMPSLTTYAINTDNKVTAVKAACCVQQSEIMSSSLHTHIHTHAHAHTPVSYTHLTLPTICSV